MEPPGPTRTALAVDFGTENMRVGVWQHGKLHLVSVGDDFHCQRYTPSVITFTTKSTRVGREALGAHDPGHFLWRDEILTTLSLTTALFLVLANTIQYIPRLLGATATHAQQLLPCVSVVESQKKNQQDTDEMYPRFGAVKVDSRGSGITLGPEQLCAILLKRAKAAAEIFVGGVVDQLVVTVPTSFNNAQRRGMVDAAAIAGFDPSGIKLSNETTALAIAACVTLFCRNDEEIVLALDLGAGAFSAAVIWVEDGIVEVCSAIGKTRLGGVDFDTRLVMYCAHRLEARHGLVLDPCSMDRLRTACEAAKRALSSSPQVTVEIQVESETYAVEITRERFEELCDDLFKEVLHCIRETIRRSERPVQRVIFSGGSFQIPKLQHMVAELAANQGWERSCLHLDEEKVLLGAAVYADLVCHHQEQGCCPDDILVIDVLTHGFGLAMAGGSSYHSIVESGVSLPCKQQTTLTTSTDTSRPPLSLQVFETRDGVYREQRVTPTTYDKRHLGDFEIHGMPPMPRGVPQVHVTYDVDANGILRVSALEKSVVEPLSVHQTSGHLSTDEINERAQWTTKAHAADECDDEWRFLRVIVLGMRDAGSPLCVLRGDSNLLEHLWGFVRARRRRQIGGAAQPVALAGPGPGAG